MLKCAGVFYACGLMTRKSWLPLDDQVSLLSERGLQIEDLSQCKDLLARIGYYHFSGYARFFQNDPNRGDNSFRAGATFTDIERLQVLDAELRDISLRYLSRVEAALRAEFSLRFGELVGAYDALFLESTFHATGPKSDPVHELVLKDLNRCKAKFVTRHRDENRRYPDLPIWAAVETLSFGTLSKCLEYGKMDSVAKTIATDLSIGHQGFSSQIRSFVSLRNECAHHSRLWNDVAKNAPIVPNNISNRAKKRYGRFTPKSHFHVLAALDRYSPGRGPNDPTLLESVESLMMQDRVFAQGILDPKPY